MEINWWQVIATVLGSSVISAILTGFWLNIRTEKIKTELLKSQIRFSFLHQKKAEAIEKLFALLAKVRNDVLVWISWNDLPRFETKEEFWLKMQQDFEELGNFFDEKRIYFDNEIRIKVSVFYGNIVVLKFQKSEAVGRAISPDAIENMEDTLKHLDEIFKEYLLVENSN